MSKNISFREKTKVIVLSTYVHMYIYTCTYMWECMQQISNCVEESGFLHAQEGGGFLETLHLFKLVHFLLLDP